MSIDNGTIRRDLRDAFARHVEIAAELKSLAERSKRTAAVEARVAHLTMLQASTICSFDQIPIEVRNYHASSAVAFAACHAESVSMRSEKSAELLRQLNEIEARELARGEPLTGVKGAGPPDFERLDDEFSEIIGRAHDVVYGFMLNRYDMPEQAKLFEEDRNAWEISVEIGSRVISPRGADPHNLQTATDAYLERTHGAATLQWIRTRSRELRRAREKRNESNEQQR